LQIKLTQGESARIWEWQTKNLRAWEKLVLARELFHRFTTEDNARSSQFLKEALDIDPDYAIARIHLGIRYYWDARYSPSVDKQIYLQMAEEQADKVSSLNPSMGSAYILKAAIALTRFTCGHRQVAGNAGAAGR
jgi:hypothetical protein